MATINFILKILIFVFFATSVTANKHNGYFRELCTYRQSKMAQPVTDFRRRLFAAREQMQIRSSLNGPTIDAYILPSCDDHLNVEVAHSDQRLYYLTGFSGVRAYAAFTLKRAAIWVEDRYLRQADSELDCDWEIYRSNDTMTIIEWLGSKLEADQKVGADPHLVPHHLWQNWEAQLENKLLYLAKIDTNLIDLIWEQDRPPVQKTVIQIHERTYAGERWESKVEELRKRLRHLKCDAMVVTSLTEIAYLLNIRGRDIPYTPVIKSYVIVTLDEVYFYVDRDQISLNIDFHLHTDCLSRICAKIRAYEHIWNDIFTYSQKWVRVLVPAPCVQEPGASEAIYSAFPHHVAFEHISPIIFMRAQKNSDEQRGMRLAHIRDGAAICDAMSSLEERFSSEQWTEEKVKHVHDLARLSQDHAKGLSLRTVIAFGEHSSLPYYISSNITDIEVNDQSLLVIESGGQYLDGSTDVSRTYIFGEPTAAMKQAYTNVLAGILALTYHKYPENITPAKVDSLVRSPIWDSLKDYPKASGHGIGVYGSVEEPPIYLNYGMNDSYKFLEGYFFSIESGYYVPDNFGVRLKNVLEVVDLKRIDPSGSRFIKFEDVTLVPYEPKLIDGSLLSATDKRNLNEYNGKIRRLVGEELKRQGNMRAFYWMMNKTRHIREYLPEEEYRAARGSGTRKGWSLIVTVPAILLGLTVFGSVLKWLC